jgi:hypothetical protein
MNWTATEVLIEIVAGIAGAHIAAVAASHYSFGRFAHAVTGAIGGAFSGCVFLMVAAAFDGARLFEQMAAHILAGATAGGILMLIVGFLKHSVAMHRASKL